MNCATIGFLVVIALVDVGRNAGGEEQKLGDPSAIRPLIDAAAKEAGVLTKPDEKTSAYLSLAVVQMTFGDAAAARQSVETALAAAAGIAEDTSSAWATAAKIFVELAGTQAEVGDVAGAKATAAKIQNNWRKAAAYGKIAAAQVKMKDMAGARQTLALAQNEIENGKASYVINLDVIYLTIAEVWTQTGDVAGAKTFVARIDNLDILCKTGCYCLIAEAQAKAGDVAAARQTLESARTLVEGNKDDPYKYWAHLQVRQTFAKIAENQAKAGDNAGAKTTLNRLQEIVRTETAGQSKTFADLANDLVSMSQESVLLATAAVQAKAGNVAEARNNIEAAKAAVAEMGDGNLKVSGYLAVIQSQQDIGDAAAARKTIEVAKTAAAKIHIKYVNDDSNNRNKIEAYCQIAAAQAKAGDAAGALKTLELAQSLIPQFDPKSSSYQSWAYGDIAGTQAAMGDMAKAKATAAQITSEDSRKRVYCDIVAAQAKADDAAGAVAFCARVLADSPSKRCKCLTDAALRLCGDREEKGTKKG